MEPAENGKDYFRRMSLYLGEMFPLAGALICSALLVLAGRIFLAEIHGLSVPLLSPGAAVAFGSLFLMIFILRLMDEIKDLEVDRALFPDRPLPSGKVLPSDIRISLVVASAAYFALNLASPRSAWSAVIVFAYSLLMYVFFFMPAILRRSLLLALMTHNPIILLLLLHAANVFAAENRLGPGSLLAPSVLLLILMHWSLFFAWEVSRKIRSPSAENAYVTYSRVLGYRKAVALAAGAQAIPLAAAFAFHRSLSLPILYPILAAAGFGFVAAGHVRFLLFPSPASSRLKSFAEAYIFWVLGAQLAGRA